jgi:hypothetical protein
MPRPSTIIALDLEQEALEARNTGKTVEQATNQLNSVLEQRDTEMEHRITPSSLERYWASLDKESVAPAHRPQLAAENARVAATLGTDLQDLHDRISRWLDQAEDAKQWVYDKDGEVIGEDIDWRARTSVAKEFRETLKFTAEMLERIYSMENVKLFQNTVLETVAKVDPDIRQEIIQRFSMNQQISRAHLLGLGG